MQKIVCLAQGQNSPLMRLKHVTPQSQVELSTNLSLHSSGYYSKVSLHNTPRYNRFVYIYRESYMNVHVLLNLLNKLGARLAEHFISFSK